MTTMEKIVRPFTPPTYAQETLTPFFITHFNPNLSPTFGIGGSPRVFSGTSSSDITRYMDAKHLENERTVQNYKITPPGGSDDGSESLTVAKTIKLTATGPNGQKNKYTYNTKEPEGIGGSTGVTVLEDGEPYVTSNNT